MIKIPHVVVEGDLEIEGIFQKLDQIFIKEDGLIIRTTNSFLSKDKTIFLLETLVIDKGSKIQFFAMVNQREDGIVVRIYPGTDIEKTDGVKRSLAEIGKQILNKFDGSKVGKTNLTDFL